MTNFNAAKFLHDMDNGWKRADFTTAVFWRDRYLAAVTIFNRSEQETREEVCFACAVGAAALGANMTPGQYLGQFDSVGCNIINEITRINDRSFSKEDAIKRIRTYLNNVQMVV